MTVLQAGEDRDGPNPPAGGGRTRGILAYFVRHRTAANLLLLLVVIAGLVSATRIRAQYFPDVSVETIRIQMNWRGVGPKEIDEALIQKVEPKLRVLDGVKQSNSRAREGEARFWLEYRPGYDMNQAMDDVRAALDDIRDLPSDVEPAIFRRTRWFDRVVNVVIAGDVGIDLLDRYADEMKANMLRRGVSAVSVVGASDPEVRVEIDPDVLERYELTMPAVAAAIRAETGAKPVGEIDRGTARVRTVSKEVSAQAIADVPVRSLPDGTKLLLRDVAQITDWGLNKKSALYFEGQTALMLRVDRDQKGDALKIQQAVEDVVKEMRPTLPSGVKVLLHASRADNISSRLWLLIMNGLTGLVIVVLLLFLFLSARTAFWVAAGIPVAMAATIAMMYVGGFSLNMISLFALLICLGIIVDDAIVVGEHADHLAGQGHSAEDAAIISAERMAAPVFAASITTVIAFAVLTLVDGRFGKMLADFPFTVGVVIIASLFEAFIILPAHMRYSLSALKFPSFVDAPSRFVNHWFRRVREGWFKSALKKLLVARYPVVAFVVLLLCLSATAIIDRTVKWQFFVSPEEPITYASFVMFESAKREDTKAQLDEFERALQAVNQRYAAEYGRAPVKAAVAEIGDTSSWRSMRAADGKIPELVGSYEIELIESDLRPYTVSKFLADWKKEVRLSPLVEVSTLRGDRSGPAGEDIEVSLLGDDEVQLKAAAEHMKQALGAYPAVTALADDLPYDKPELVLSLTPKGEALGFNTESISRLLRERLYGIEAVKLAKGSREITVRVKLPDAVAGPNYLRQAKLPVPGTFAFVPLSEIATVKQTAGFSSIRRENGRRHVTVNGDIVDDPGANADVLRALRDLILPEVKAKFGVDWKLSGLLEQERDFLSDAQMGFWLAIAAIYLVLAWVFGSWSRPVLIMVVIPFGLVGAVFGHWLHGIPLSMFSVVGLIGMAGIIINDSIVLVRTIDEKIERQDVLTAVIEGTAERLRAVLLTTLTTVGGLMPLLFEASRQAQFLKPAVVTLVYGLGFGMILVLLLTPALIAIEHDVRMRIASLRRMVRLSRRKARFAEQGKARFAEQGK
jgi:multidrug efflux pump subunit AcrB